MEAGLATDLAPAQQGGKVTKAAAKAAFAKIPDSVAPFVNSSLVKDLDDEAGIEILVDVSLIQGPGQCKGIELLFDVCIIRVIGNGQ